MEYPLWTVLNRFDRYLGVLLLPRTFARHLILLFAAVLAHAQAPASLHLDVKDPSGTPMSASGKLSGPVNRGFQTDSQGSANLSGLNPGEYQLVLAAAGFATQTIRIPLAPGETASRTVTMVLAQSETRLDVVATTPLPGVDLATYQVAAAVQSASQSEIGASGALDLPEFLNRRLNGVYLNEMQGNPFMPDLNFRGYTASPILGTPQGIAVYMDGVRQNQPFGDVVGWDLIPKNAISAMTLVPGSDPLFGLNALGGALSIQSKDGTTSPGLSGNATYGASGRKAVEAEMGGGKATGFNWFLAGSAFHESGWRVDSPSDVRQGFARLGWRTAKTDVAGTASYAYNTLTGNALQDYRLLKVDYRSVYTVPDTVANRAPAFNLIAKRTVSPTVTLSGNIYYRNIRTAGNNGNLNNNSLDESVYQPSAADITALKNAGYTGYPTSGANSSNTPFPKWRCIAQGLQFQEAIEKCNADTVFSKSVQHDFGFSGQYTRQSTPGFARGGQNQLAVGASFARGAVAYTQNTQFGYLNPDRSITGIPNWEDGTTNSNGEPVDTRVNLHGTTPTVSLFATDTLTLGKAWNLTFSGRYNHNEIHNTDRFQPKAGPGSLTGTYSFDRLSPALGITYSPAESWNIYASYIQGSRAPTSIELGCADPTDPCTLPNAFSSDPPLKQVVTQTWQFGLRGKTASHMNWTAGAFTAENSNDILFIAAQQTGTGYFKNFGKTRRRGVQASVDGHYRSLTGGLDYTYLEATYQSKETLDGNANNTSDLALAGFPGLGGTITIHPGNRIPLVPKQTGKAFVEFQPVARFSVGMNLLASSSSYALGNENNAYKADGKYYQGPGVSPGYAVLNFRAHYDLTHRLTLSLQVDNLTDRHFYTAAQLANTGFTVQGNFIARPYPAYGAGPQSGNYPLQSVTFFAPGAPRRTWVELRIKF